MGIVENFFDFSDPNSAVMAELQAALQRTTADTIRDRTAFTLVDDSPSTAATQTFDEPSSAGPT
jgi:hypothetical protein